jgi:penicillin-binding protein 2B
MKRSRFILSLIFLLNVGFMIFLTYHLYSVIILGVHVNSGTDLKLYSSQVNTMTRILPAERGMILDRNGEIIAQDVISYTLFAIVSPTRPSYQNRPAHVVDIDETARILADYLNAPYEYMRQQMLNASYQTEFGVFGRQVSQQVKDEIDAYKLPGIGFIQNASRNYPLNHFASYLVGFVNQEPVGNRLILVGRMGIEANYNTLLAGVNGSRLAVVDRFGFELPGYPVHETKAQNGAHVVLTIDRTIQEQLESSFINTVELFNASEVYGAVLEASTGKILASGQYPSFNPNLMNISNYQNALTQVLYEPGSTMKTFTYAAAIDTGVYDGEATFNSNTFIVGLDAQGNAIRISNLDRSIGSIRNANNRQWGVISYDTGYAYSANTGIASLLTTRLNPSVYHEYLVKFGFTNRVNVDGFSETLGRINFQYPLEKLAVGYGQGLSVNMAQMLQAYTAIFNNGILVKPYLLDRVIDPITNLNIQKTQTTQLGQAIQPSTAQRVIDLMALAVEDPRGTGQHYRIDEVDIVAKTGTAQLAIGGAYSTDEYIYSVAIGLPKENPEIIIYYAFRAPATTQAHIQTDPVRKLILQVAISYDYRKAEFKSAIQVPTAHEKLIVMPNLTNQSTDDINQLLSEFNNITIIGHNQSIIDQYPKANTIISNSQRILLLTSLDQLRMIDLSGFSKRDVTGYFNLIQQPFKLIGEGRAFAQSIEPNELLKSLETIEVYFE